MIIEEYSKFKNKINLKPRYLRIFEFRHGVNGQSHTLKESGKTFNVSPERIRQIIARVLCELGKLVR